MEETLEKFIEVLAEKSVANMKSFEKVKKEAEQEEDAEWMMSLRSGEGSYDNAMNDVFDTLEELGLIQENEIDDLIVKFGLKL